MYPGKSHAVIHDLMVIPPEDKGDAIDETERGVVASELRRIVEFASCARNGARARLSILEVAKRYGVLDILSRGDE